MSCQFKHAPLPSLRLITYLGTNGQRYIHHLLDVNPKRWRVGNMLAIMKSNDTGGRRQTTSLYPVSYLSGLLSEQLYPFGDGCAFDCGAT